MVEIDEIAPLETGKNSFQVMLFEYKTGLNEYFSSLGEDAYIKNIEDLIKFFIVGSFIKDLMMSGLMSIP